jgi:hypothetical protein
MIFTEYREARAADQGEIRKKSEDVALATLTSMES